MAAATPKPTRRHALRKGRVAATLTALALSAAVLWSAPPAAAALLAQHHSAPVDRPPLTGRIVIVVVLLATKPFVVRSTHVRRFRSELRELDAVALSWRDRSQHDDR